MGVLTARAPLLTLQGGTPYDPVLFFEAQRTQAAFIYMLPFLGSGCLIEFGAVQCQVGVGIYFMVHDARWGSLTFSVKSLSPFRGDGGRD